jgi:hypothetical protein
MVLRIDDICEEMYLDRRRAVIRDAVRAARDLERERATLAAQLAEAVGHLRWFVEITGSPGPNNPGVVAARAYLAKVDVAKAIP